MTKLLGSFLEYRLLKLFINNFSSFIARMMMFISIIIGLNNSKNKKNDIKNSNIKEYSNSSNISINSSGSSVSISNNNRSGGDSISDSIREAVAAVNISSSSNNISNINSSVKISGSIGSNISINSRRSGCISNNRNGNDGNI
ncbi:hypothetical protein ACTA71_009428 [Dictyostelium dimigraforme]